jgi:ABC-2 type transport system ATP-binding protein
VVILHRGKVVADDSIERLRSVMAASTLEDIFAQLASDRDAASVSRQIADLIDECLVRGASGAALAALRDAEQVP